MFRVDSVLVRVTKSNNFVMVSATQDEVASQPIMAFTPLVIEPPKKFFCE